MPQHGYTPLHQAAQHGHVNVISCLLTHGASPDCITPVRCLITQSHSRIILSDVSEKCLPHILLPEETATDIDIFLAHHVLHVYSLPDV